MQKLDVTKTEAAWSSLARKVYVPHSEEEYGQLVALLDSFIDEVGEDESHPLASLMEIVGVLIEKYEDEQVPELSDALRAGAMSNNYAHAADRARQFFVSLSLESDALNTKINEYSDRLVRITKQDHPVEFEAIINGSASDLELYVQRIEALIPDYRRDLKVTTEGFDQIVRSLDPSTSAGAKELEGFRREARRLTETAREAKPKVTVLRHVFEALRDSNHDLRLTEAARRGVALADDLSNAYEDLETLALKVSFSAGQS